jgi:hypothetical protein
MIGMSLMLYPRKSSRYNHRRYSSQTLKFFKNGLVIRNTADMTGGKPSSQSVSGVRAVNPLFALYNICGRKGVVLCFLILIYIVCVSMPNKIIS